MTQFLIGLIIGIIGGAFLGAYLVTNFDVTDVSYVIDKLRAKKGGVIDITQDIKPSTPEKKEKRKLFSKLKDRRDKK